ncbi:hypothetical protein C9I98_11195 [Photobacterium sanctipauli]|uniref:Uncharacterized protein n=1 Tax=Photobacterium sanctipauli TaxID=1342794 RepID=A0A2T3NT90_9GAMM|nr:hypothetical protein [Photobacterium sanctipauli]PSW19478.1 hypothetical protein C9I98_11195 [Photobacterium sanctipauli]
MLKGIAPFYWGNLEVTACKKVVCNEFSAYEFSAKEYRANDFRLLIHPILSSHRLRFFIVFFELFKAKGELEHANE